MMMKNECSDFQRLLRSAFAELFNNKDALITYERRVGPNRCLLIVDLEDCRFRFKFDQGSLGAAIGQPDAPSVWAENGDENRSWFNANSTLDYLEGLEKPGLEEIFQRIDRSREQALEVRANEIAGRLIPQINEVCGLFSSSAKSTEFEDFIDYYLENSYLMVQAKARQSGENE